MYRVPSRKRKNKGIKKPNLIPILDAVFIFIFFLLMSSSFINIFEIPSQIPMVSSEPPPQDREEPLALTLEIEANELVLRSGIPAREIERFGREGEQYDLYRLRERLIQIKKENATEDTIVFLPRVDLTYGQLVEIMDSVRILGRTEEAIYYTDENGMDIRVTELFSNIIFGNIRG